MYREAVALAVHRRRPGLDVSATTPETAEETLAGFRPHVLLHNDTAPIPAGAMDGVPCRVEVLYTDSMDAPVHRGGAISEVRDMSTEVLLRVIDGTAARAIGRGAPEVGG
jgi:hypothetical protein